ncbi:MAG: hypothetical protein ABW166_13870 [Sedimenticola sp.]
MKINNLSVGDLKPGMVVASGVSNLSGQTLLQANTPVTPEIIRMLRSWGVEHVSVIPLEGSEPEVAQSSTDTPHNQALRTALEQRFRLTQRDHPVIQAVFSSCLERALIRIPNE